jgi:hypothetical protein
MADTETLTPRAIDLLGQLVAFDITSRGSNLALIAHVKAYQAGHGVSSRRVLNGDRTKVNLLASIGPSVEGGVVLSGHKDVAHVFSQTMSSDPLVLTVTAGQLCARNLHMKELLASALAAMPDLVAWPLRRPVYLAFSYYEEVGFSGSTKPDHRLRCLGAASSYGNCRLTQRHGCRSRPERRDRLSVYFHHPRALLQPETPLGFGKYGLCTYNAGLVAAGRSCENNTDLTSPFRPCGGQPLQQSGSPAR